MNLKNSLLLITALLCITHSVQPSENKIKFKRRSHAVPIPILKQDSTVNVLNPLYEKPAPEESLTKILSVFYQIPGVQEFVTKIDFDDYKQTHTNLIQRTTYSNQGTKIVYAWEEDPVPNNFMLYGSDEE